MGKDQELLEAARSGNTAVVEKILGQRAKRSGPLASLRRGPGANVQDSSGYSSLHHAALNGHRDIVELLLSNEASTNILDAAGSSPLHLAAWRGSTDIVRLLLCHGPSVPNVNLTTKDNETALHCASQYGHTAVVSLLLEHSCDPTIRNSREESALDLAAQYGRLETVELLVRTHPELIQPYSRHACTPNSVFPHTPLHLASRNGHRSVVEVLLAAGMSVNIHTRGGTALHEAALCGKLEVVRTLLDAGVDLGARDAKHNTVLDLLSLFPKHATAAHDIYATIKRHPSYRRVEDSDSDGGLPPIPVPNLGSPYENVRLQDDRAHSPSSSPSRHWAPNRNHTALSKSLGNDSFLSGGRYHVHRDADQLSISSMASSTSSVSPRYPGSDCGNGNGGAYMPMTHGPGLPSPGSGTSKVSPRAPKKPPRRNLSVSPTHLTPSGSGGPYEYLYLSRSGEDSLSVSSAGSGKLRRGRSADQYEVMKLRDSYVMPIDLDSPVMQRRKSEHEPIALTYVCDDIQVRTTNPRRKLRRNHMDRDKVYENFDPPQTFVSNAYITLKSSAESLLDGPKGHVNGNGTSWPLSPTNYQQPPTPDHPPPSAKEAELRIHERMRPLSQEYKRRSRDMETETEEELLVYSISMDSSGSLSSSISLSDKSVSTENNVEEFIGDAPFAGLLKGSTKQLMEVGTRVIPAERPKTLRKLRNVYENVSLPSGGADGDNGLSILSPFDEQEEWNKISEIMATFNAGLLKDGVLVSEMEKEIQARFGMTPQKSLDESPKSSTEIGKWLESLQLEKYENTLLDNGYDHLDFLNGILDEGELERLGVTDPEHVQTLMDAVKKLPARASDIAANDCKGPVEAWLAGIHLNQYRDVFRRHLYLDMERVSRIWEVELNTVLDITKSGHRRRILVSVGGSQRTGSEPSLEGINTDLNLLKSNIQQLKEEIKEKIPPAAPTPVAAGGTGTLRHSHKKSRPAPPPPTSAVNGKPVVSNTPDLEIRNPSELLVGVPATLTAQWRHRPEDLVCGKVTYVANYLGSTVVKELKGTESTKKSIQKLKKNTSKELIATPGIVLEISYRGVKFLTASTREPVCEHEIRNIHCACQDADDLTHFAYITKDHVSRSHYCHVFCVDSMDQATEVILTLGQAFEVAYQMALRDQFTSRSHGNGHTRSQSANQIVITPNNTHARSLSEVKVNGTEGEGPGKAPLVLNEDL